MDNSRRQWRFPVREIRVAFVSNNNYNIFLLENDVAAATRHAIFVFIVHVMLVLVQIMFQNKDMSPFQTHPKTMWTATISLLMYCFAYHIETRFSSSTYYANLVSTIMVFLGSLSVACLASVFFPIEVQFEFYQHTEREEI